MSSTLIFEPVAQNTIIRPLAEAVCILHGGKMTPYIDTADHKEKSVSLNDLHFLCLQAQADGQIIDGYQAAFQARHNALKIRVNINDIPVMISPETTVAQAMDQFKRKFAQKNKGHLASVNFSKQRD